MYQAEISPINGEGFLGASRVLPFEVGLFYASAERQQVAVALDPLCQLVVGQPGGQYGEEVTEYQRVQLSRPATHAQRQTL